MYKKTIGKQETLIRYLRAHQTGEAGNKGDSDIPSRMKHG